jgi:hypothetical protein
MLKTTRRMISPRSRMARELLRGARGAAKSRRRRMPITASLPTALEGVPGSNQNPVTDD